MAWNKVLLTTEQIEEQRVLETLEKRFEKLFIAADGPEDMALLSDNEYKDGRITIYFTPGCSPCCDDLISQYSGEECDPPTIDHVFLLDGNDDALDLLT
ncbi:MAG: hypothetical protein ACE5GZ_02810 [Gammaproteobacteria bacterium]